MLLPRSLLIVWLAAASSPVLATTAGSFADGGNTLVSALMMFLGNKEKVYILDKAEGNAAQVKGHPAWASVWDIATKQATVMDVRSNTFCASGMHLPNGSYITFGGNGAVGRGGNVGSQKYPWGSGAWDAEYQDFDGTKAIRVLNPCTSADDFNSPNCQWYDDASVLSMQKQRWYSTAEALADGSVVLIGGFVNGGYINRNYPNTDPQFEGGAAENTYEFYPANGRGVQALQFLIKTSGLNAYAHAFLLNSGKMLVQANVSTMIWDYNANQETPLPDMPNNVVRVYPASGAVAMLPLTPANNWNPTLLFCGGSDMPDEAWGSYANPAINTWNYPASRDCQRLTPEPADGSAPAYEADDDMLEGRTMGQFIILPDGKMLVINGGLNGTAGYATATGQTASYGDMPFGMSLASGPVGTPAIYDPNAPKGQRWSNAGLSTSNIARLYHSSAILLPDASVLVAGSNPNVDVNTSTIFPTEYRAEIFYPPYFAAKTRPAPTGIPNTISYGGNSFDITIPASSYSGSANAAAGNTTVVLLRGGFTTHAMNMGQRYVQLNNTFTVQSDGSITLHVAQAPNPNIIQPGPALVFVTVNGIPSVGTMVIVGNGAIGTQPTAPPAQLPPSVLLDDVKGSADGSSTNTGGGTQNNQSNGAAGHTGAIVGGVIGAIAVIGLLGALLGVFLARRRRASPLGAHHTRIPSQKSINSAYAMTAAGGGVGGAAALAGPGMRGMRSSDSSAFVPLQHDNSSEAWGGSTADLTSPYMDHDPAGRTMVSMEYDPYAAGSPRITTSSVPNRYQ
ncbi:putative glyoxal oxidase [Lyophyllum shimeji]|uniref:Glyoxal oxidase n=1 Tax=Lyophyllum shimeji TaxID=47721 RepID=A0A9P3PRC1_LYOSH|nr:putative glyoxal oxidase [Lyophyllum shimeji]